jgi:hypothetical protein
MKYPKTITSLDFFAAAALIGLISRGQRQGLEKEEPTKWLSNLAYEYAEEMIEAKLDMEEQ